MKPLFINLCFVWAVSSLHQNVSANTHIILLPIEEKISYPVSPISPIKKKLKHNNNKISLKKKLTPNVKNNETATKTILVVSGIVILLLGLIILWYVSIILGAFLSLLGIALLIFGFVKNNNKHANNNDNSKSDTNNKKDKAPMPASKRDVVYLKNGSIIKGEIIEQIMGESVKIQTADGSIFIYKSAEVEKITKE